MIENAKQTIPSEDYSVRKRKWQLLEHNPRTALALTQRHNLHPLVANILSMRIKTLDDAQAFLQPALRHDLPDPSLLLDMDKATNAAYKAISSNTAIAVWGDYDVDGSASSALLLKLFKALNITAELYIPDRLTEGYGPNVNGLEYLKRSGNGLVIMVDCGATAYEAIEYAKKIGLQTIVLDHHIGEALPPPANAIVNPNRPDDTSNLNMLCGAGVSFMFAVAFVRELRIRGYFANKPEPNLMEYLDLVALGTICDVMPLKGINRTFVAQGLKVMKDRLNNGLNLLCDLAKLQRMPTSSDLGFAIGPRINAGGRIGESNLGAKLLSGLYKNEENAIAVQLESLNQQRKDIEKECLVQALEKVKSDDPFVVLSACEGWHPGIIGIIASRLKDQFNRAAIVLTIEGDIATGSGRSIPNLDLGTAVTAARQQGILISGGGHKMAAGFKLSTNNIDSFFTFVAAFFSKQCDHKPLDFITQVDASLPVSALNRNLLESLMTLAPFGAGNRQPSFMIKYARIIKPKIVGENHISCFINTIEDSSFTVKAIAFKAINGTFNEASWGNVLLSPPQTGVHLYGHLQADNWMERNNVQFIIEDIALPNENQYI